MKKLSLENAVILLIGAIFFLPLVIKILYFKQTAYQSDKKIIIILGAQITKDGLSNVLKRRMQLAVDLGSEKTLYVVTGGQGSDEPCSEA